MRYTTFMLLTAIAVSTPGRAANEGNDIARRSDFLNHASHMDQEYRSVRDDVEKSGGLRDRFDAVTMEMKTWLSSWSSLDDLTKNPPDISLLEMDQQIGLKLNAIDDGLHSIEAGAGNLAFDLNSNADRLTTLGTIPYRIPSYDLGKTGQDATEQRISELSAALRDSSRSLMDNLQAFRTALGVLRQAFSYRASAIWTAKGIATLDASMRTIDELFTSIAALQPLQDDLIKAAGAYQVAFSRYNMMEAFDNLVIVKNRCDGLPQAIDALSIADRYKVAAKDRFASTCLTFAQRYTRFNGHLAEAVESGIAHRKPRIAAVCQSDQSQTMNCPLFSSVEAINGLQIKALKQDGLRNLEKLYTAIEDNRRRGNIFH